MDEACKFCGVGHYAHKRLACGAQVARLEAANGAKNAKLLAWAGNLGLWFDDPKLMELADKMVELATSGPLGEPFFKTKADAERALEQVEREYDAAIERAEAAEALLRNLRRWMDEAQPQWEMALAIDVFFTPTEAQARQKGGGG